VLATNNTVVKKEMLSRFSLAEQKKFQIVTAPYRLDAIGNWKGLVKYFLSSPFAIVWCVATLRQLKNRYDRVTCLWPGFSDRLTFSPVAKFFHCPLIWIDIGPLEPVFKRTWGFPRLLYGFAQRFPDHVVTTSLFTKKSLMRNSRFTDADITLVCPGTRIFSPAEIASFKHKKQTAIQIGVVARLAHENEIGVTIEAFKKYVQEFPNQKITLLIIGDGPARVELEKQAEILGDKVHFTGFVSETKKRELLANCSFFIFPRAWEWDGFGMTTIEAMALGLPVLTTDFGPQIEIITDGKEGYTYTPHDSSDLSRKIAKMINLSPQERKKMSAAAIQRAKDFSEEISHTSMLSVIERYGN